MNYKTFLIKNVKLARIIRKRQWNDRGNKWMNEEILKRVNKGIKNG